MVTSLEVNPGDHKRLDPVKVGGIWGCRGRLGESGLRQLVGTNFLPILPQKCDLACLLMQQAHEENHDEVDGTLGRSRSKAWTVRGRYVARDICNSCHYCSVRKYKEREQRMGDLPQERVMPYMKLFMAICTDLFGPYLVRGIVNKRAMMKTWPILFVCQASGALHCELMPTAGTALLLLQWKRFTAIREDPEVVVSDKGSQLTSKNNTVAFSDKEAPAAWGWDEMRSESARKGTDWRWVPAGCQFRNCLAERRVATLRRTLDHLISSYMISSKPTLDYVELSVLLYRVCNVVNDRPVHLKNLTEDIKVPLTVNQLLLVKTTTARPLVSSTVNKEVENYHALDSYLRELMKTWWDMWKVQALPTLLPYYCGKDADRHKNLVVGDVCLLLYENKVVAHYCLVRVSEVKKSKDNCVRTVVVAYLPENQLKKKEYDPLKLQCKEVAVQRLALIVPNEEVELQEQQ